MSKINLNRNLFLEREEILRFQKFMLESAVNKTFLSNTTNWGIIDTSGGSSPNDFKVEAGSTSGTVKISNLSRALQNEGLLIEQKAFDNLAIPNDSSYYWLKIGHTYSKLEEGTISISSQGVVTGVGTKFTEVLRGQSTEVPVKIKLVSTNNIAIYEIVDVVDDLNLVLQGESFVAENGISYYVIGSTPLGVTITTEQQEGLYDYDSCLITQVSETVEDTEPAGLVNGEEFWIARVINNSGTVTIEDKRTGYYWEYYIRGVSDKLDKDENLNDLPNKTTARANLNVYSQIEVDNLLNLTEVGWTTMDRGETAADASGYDIKFSRIGKLCTITGKFTTISGAAAGAIVASIPWSTVAGSEDVIVNLTNNVYIQSSTVDDAASGKNRGMGFYVAARGESDDLQLKVLENVDSTDILFTITFNLI